MLNTTTDLYKRAWLNLVFKDRNKAYGAYALRLQSAGNTLRALFIAAPLFVLVFAAPMIRKWIRGDEQVVSLASPEREIIVEMAPRVEQQKTEPTKAEEKKPEVPDPAPVKKKIKTVALPSSPKVVSTPVETEPPTLAQLENAAVGPVTQDGEATNLVSVPAEGTGNGSLGSGTGAGQSGNGSGEEIMEMSGNIQAFPEFEGGQKGWARYLQRNLRYPSEAQEINLQGKVFVSFVVERDGSVSNVQIERGIHKSLDEEAIRVILRSPKWKPGVQNGRNVRVRFHMPISFSISI
ncbi:energy transducer TonB [Pedobacter sp. JY14-1]|uniref:energy transducer TonB n=1 Tax=Pedobacter sp. JY14-1 TaxID=3034151 RepID=UPI0023E10694|nr:energy transducer TonB [Pedobacter sp. JY14-1]